MSALTLDGLPLPADPAQVEIEWGRWRQAAQSTEDPTRAAAMRAVESLPPARRWLEAIFGNSPFLTHLALRDPSIVLSVFDQGPDNTLAELLDALNAEQATLHRATLMSRLR
ncbi:MAG: glutamine-synthetase adenylyltransferase, partial [Aliidongia sp.]